jgi:hypothetical protein
MGAPRRWWLPLVVSAVLLVAAAVVGRQQPGGFVVLGWLDRPFVFGTVALGLLALACWLAVAHPVWRPISAVLLAMVALSWAGLGVAVDALSLTGDLSEHSRYRSPDGDRELVVYSGSVVIDPTWELRVRSGTGLATREWDGGCINTEQASFTRAEWAGPDQLRIHLAGGDPITMRLDGTTGRPDHPVSMGC